MFLCDCLLFRGGKSGEYKIKPILLILVLGLLATTNHYSKETRKISRYLHKTFGQHLAVKTLKDILLLYILEHCHNLNNKKKHHGISIAA